MKEQLRLPPSHEGAVWFHTQRSPHFPMHRHDELELNLVRRGTARYLLDNGRYDVAAGTAVWLFPAQNHVLLERSADFEMWILVFRQGLLRRLCTDTDRRELLQDNPTAHYCRQLAAAQVRRLEGLFRALAEASADLLLLNAGLGYALLATWKAYSAPGTWLLAGVDVHPAVEKAVQLLRRETSPLATNGLARQCGLSYSRLGALFKQQTGVSVGEFRNRQRLERFLAIYGTGQRATLMEAALAAGFGSYPQFHRVFSRAMGCSPSAHRER